MGILNLSSILALFAALLGLGLLAIAAKMVFGSGKTELRRNGTTVANIAIGLVVAGLAVIALSGTALIYAFRNQINAYFNLGGG